MAKYGNVWHPLKPTVGQILEIKPRLDAALEAENRSGDGFPVAPKLAPTLQDEPARPGQEPAEGRPRDIIDALKRFRDAGASEFCFDVKVETGQATLDTIERFVQEIRPKLE